MLSQEHRNADYWLNRAEEIRGVAVQLNDSMSRGALIVIVDVYERMARRVVQQSTSKEEERKERRS